MYGHYFGMGDRALSHAGATGFKVSKSKKGKKKSKSNSMNVYDATNFPVSTGY